jgi:hypothetical protein
MSCKKAFLLLFERLFYLVTISDEKFGDTVNKGRKTKADFRNNMKYNRF